MPRSLVAQFAEEGLSTQEPINSSCRRVLALRSPVAQFAEEGLSAQEPSNLVCRA